MAVAVSTDLFRQEMADWLLQKLPAATMAYGSGGVDNQGKVLAPDPGQIGLRQLLGEFPLQSFGRIDNTTVEATGRLNKGDLVGVPISEAGLKVGGSLYAVRNFATKIFESDEYFDINIEITF